MVRAVRHGGQRFVVERHGTPVAAIVPLDDLAQLEGGLAQGVLALVAAFDHAPELPDVLDEVVAGRAGERSRPAPRLS